MSFVVHPSGPPLWPAKFGRFWIYSVQKWSDIGAQGPNSAGTKSPRRFRGSKNQVVAVQGGQNRRLVLQCFAVVVVVDFRGLSGASREPGPGGPGPGSRTEHYSHDSSASLLQARFEGAGRSQDVDGLCVLHELNGRTLGERCHTRAVHIRPTPNVSIAPTGCQF